MSKLKLPPCVEIQLTCATYHVYSARVADYEMVQYFFYIQYWSTLKITNIKIFKYYINIWHNIYYIYLCGNSFIYAKVE
jgi:hypothetical protein